jgi:hypothetical protein
MSLALIPSLVLCSIRKLMYIFLWKKNQDFGTIHLCNWEKLALPKEFGGWGFLNIFYFSKALAAHTLWRVITSGGMWHMIIMDKYLMHLTISQ